MCLSGKHLNYGKTLYFEIEGSEERAIASLLLKEGIFVRCYCCPFAEMATSTNPKGQAGDNAFWVVRFNIVIKNLYNERAKPYPFIQFIIQFKFQINYTFIKGSELAW